MQYKPWLEVPGNTITHSDVLLPLLLPDIFKPNNLNLESLPGLELLKCDLDHAKNLTKALWADTPGPLLLTSDDSESLIRIRSVAFDALKLCVLKSPYDHGVLRITAGDAYPTVDDNGEFHVTMGESYQTIDPPHLVWIDMLDGEALSSDLADRINAAKSGSESTGRLLVTCGRAHLKSSIHFTVEPDR